MKILMNLLNLPEKARPSSAPIAKNKGSRAKKSVEKSVSYTA